MNRKVGGCYLLLSTRAVPKSRVYLLLSTRAVPKSPYLCLSTNIYISAHCRHGGWHRSGGSAEEAGDAARAAEQLLAASLRGATPGYELLRSSAKTSVAGCAACTHAHSFCTHAHVQCPVMPMLAALAAGTSARVLVALRMNFPELLMLLREICYSMSASRMNMGQSD